MKAVFRKELSSYFHTMTGYVFLAFMIAVLGTYFTTTNIIQGNPYFTASLQSARVVFVFAVPILTMRSMAEERRAKTDQTFLTSPNSVASVILGKYLAMVLIFAIPAAVSLLCPFIISTLGTGHPRADYAAIFMFFLIGCLYIAIGLWISALTESQITAAVGTIAVLLLLYLWDDLLAFVPYTPVASLVGFLVLCFIFLLIIRAVTGKLLPAGIIWLCLSCICVVVYFVNDTLYAGQIKKVLEAFSVNSALSSILTSSFLDLRIVILCLTGIFLFLFLTIQSVRKRQWL